jgi:hypothetical protein
MQCVYRPVPAGLMAFSGILSSSSSTMTEFLSPGDPLPHIPDDLTLVQFTLDSTHECKPIRPQGATWLIEDATGRKIGLGEVTILPVVCASVWT